MVTCASVVLVLVGAGLTVLPFAEPSPDPVRIDAARVDAAGVHVAVRVLRRGRLRVDVRTLQGRVARVLVPERPVIPGVVELKWDGRRAAGDAARGSYMVRATAYPGLRPYVTERRLTVGG
jgi:hypothetical protein